MIHCSPVNVCVLCILEYGCLPILQNYLNADNLNEVQSSLLTFFFQNFEEVFFQ